MEKVINANELREKIRKLLKEKKQESIPEVLLDLVIWSIGNEYEP